MSDLNDKISQTAEEEPTLQVNYFPYLSMSDVAEIYFPDLNVKVWNYQLKADEYVTDPLIRAQLDLIIGANVGRWHEVNNIGIISVGAVDWRQLNEEELAICREARLLLFIRTISRTAVLERGPNVGHSQFTTENFLLTTQNFSRSNERMGITSGFIVRKSVSGFRLRDIKFQKPDHVPTPIGFLHDEIFFSDFMRIRKYQKKLYRRLLRAVEALSQAYLNDTSLRMASRIPIIASAYESLFDLPEQGQRKELKEYFRKNIAPTHKRKFRHTSQRPRSPKGFVWEVDDISVMWVDKFYSLRNKIIHGSQLKDEDFIFRGKQDHFDIALIFFIFGFKKIMSSKSQIKDTIDEVHWKTPEQRDDDWPVYEGFVYDDYDMFRGMKWK